MRYIFSILLCLILQTGFSQIIKTVGISYTNGTPTYIPAKAGSWLALDTVTWRYYTWNGASWLSDGFRVQSISGCSAPAYTPTKFQSYLVINACTAGQGGPELYFWTGSVWLQINEGQTYTAGTGIDITGNVISNTLLVERILSSSTTVDFLLPTLYGSDFAPITGRNVGIDLNNATFIDQYMIHNSSVAPIFSPLNVMVSGVYMLNSNNVICFRKLSATQILVQINL